MVYPNQRIMSKQPDNVLYLVQLTYIYYTIKHIGPKYSGRISILNTTDRYMLHSEAKVTIRVPHSLRAMESEARARSPREA